MNLWKWKKELELGLPILDEQHFKFFKQVNHFLILVKFKKNKAACKDSISFLEHYLLSHFNAEFAFMKESGYPKAREHQASHDILKIQTKAIFIKVEEEQYSNEVLEEFQNFLNMWIIKHILEEDYDFVKYYTALEDTKK